MGGAEKHDDVVLALRDVVRSGILKFHGQPPPQTADRRCGSDLLGNAVNYRCRVFFPIRLVAPRGASNYQSLSSARRRVQLFGLTANLLAPIKTKKPV